MLRSNNVPAAILIVAFCVIIITQFLLFTAANTRTYVHICIHLGGIEI